jgi:hypothetical protein
MAEKTKKEKQKVCQTCGADVRQDVCMGCMLDMDKCICNKDVTSSVYPM